MIKEVEKIICESDIMILSTSGSAKFPHCIALPEPLLRNSYYTMEFCLNKNSRSVKNVLKDRKGSIYILKSQTKESVLLKGVLSIEPITDYECILTLTKKPCQEIAKNPEPVIISFETITIEQFN